VVFGCPSRRRRYHEETRLVIFVEDPFMPRHGPVSRSARPGWTLTELLVVIAVILILAALGFFLVQSGHDAAQRIHAEAHAAALKVKRSQQLRPAQSKKTLAKVNRQRPTGPVPNRYIVQFKATTNPTAAAGELAREAGAQIHHVYSGVFAGAAVEADDQAIARVREHPAVARIVQDQYASIAAETVPTGLQRLSVARTRVTPPVILSIPGVINAQGLRNLRNAPGSAAGITVAVIDSGIDGNHPDLNITNSLGFGFPDGLDQNGHGTHVAGTIGARRNDQGVVGVFPGVAMWSLRVFDAQGSGISTDIMAALDYVAKRPGQVQVVNMSLGTVTLQPLNAMIDGLTAQGVVCVSAAGNSSVSAATSSPASAATSITVAALADADGLPGGKGGATSAGADDTFATFSNFGSNVTVIAPGVDILSTLPGGGYGVQSGTSMAAPHVAGMAALIVAGGNNLRSLGTPRNVRAPGSALPAINIVANPAAVRALILSNCVERIPGIFDNIQYPLVAGLP
jgi:subtilisin